MKNEVRIFRGKEGEAERSGTWSWEGPESPSLVSLILVGEEVTDTGMPSTFQTPAVSVLGGKVTARDLQDVFVSKNTSRDI